MVLTNDIIGYTASSFYIISLFPELYYLYINKKCNLSIYFLFFQVVTTLLFITYDLLIEVIPLLVADATLLTELFILIFFKYYFRRNQKTMIVVKSSTV